MFIILIPKNNITQQNRTWHMQIYVYKLHRMVIAETIFQHMIYGMCVRSAELLVVHRAKSSKDKWCTLHRVCYFSSKKLENIPKNFQPGQLNMVPPILHLHHPENDSFIKPYKC